MLLQAQVMPYTGNVTVLLAGVVLRQISCAILLLLQKVSYLR